MNKLLTTRNLTIINLTIVFYFILIWLINFYEIDYVLIGVFYEMLTIPFLVAQIVFLFLGIKYLMQPPRHYLVIISVVILAICTIITIGSFFKYRILASL